MNGPVTTFLRWWWRTLWETLPPSWRRAQAVPGQAVVFDRDSDGLHVSRYRRGWMSALGRVALSDPGADAPDALAQEEWRALLDRYPAIAKLPIIVRLAVADTARLRVRTARRDYVRDRQATMAAIIRQRLDDGAAERPWVATDRSALTAGQEVDLDVHVAHRQSMDAAVGLVSRLTQWTLARPLVVTPAGTDAARWRDLALLTQGPALPRDGASRFVGPALAGVLILAIAAGVSPLIRQQARISHLEQAVAAEQQAAGDAAVIEARLNTVMTSWSALVERRRTRPYMVSVLDAVSRRLPNDTSLVQFYVSERSATLGGSSGSPDDLADMLAADPLFSSARHRFAPTFDPTTRRHHVQLTIGLAGFER
ncbi:MAG: hypothetical protein RIE31_04980 [Alphaproteobacteria bacterium]